MARGFRTSFRLAPGIRVSVSPTGVGVSAGNRLGRTSAHSSGRVSQTVRLPGTGVSATGTANAAGGGRVSSTVRTPAGSLTTTGRPGGSRRVGPATASSGRRTATPGPSAPSGAGGARLERTATPSGTESPRVPARSAPRWEQDLYRAVTAGTPEDVRAVALTEGSRPLPALLTVVQCLLPEGDVGGARAVLADLWESGYDPAREAFVQHHLADARIEVTVGEIAVEAEGGDDGRSPAEAPAAENGGVTPVGLPVDRGTIGALLNGLLLHAGSLHEVVALTDGLTADGAAGTLMLIHRGCALRRLGHPDAAHEVLTTALAPRSRPEPLRLLAWSERAACCAALGRGAQARRDLDRILARDAGYPGLRERRDALAPPSPGGSTEGMGEPLR